MNIIYGIGKYGLHSIVMRDPPPLIHSKHGSKLVTPTHIVYEYFTELKYQCMFVKCILDR